MTLPVVERNFNSATRDPARHARYYVIPCLYDRFTWFEHQLTSLIFCFTSRDLDEPKALAIRSSINSSKDLNWNETVPAFI